MDLKKLAKIKIELKNLLNKQHSIKPSELQSIAKQLGRSMVDRGKEPNYEKKDPPPFPYPLSIPNHKPTLKAGTAKSVIGTLFDDADIWELYLNE
ncbi:hypothetical protein ACL9RI_17180 [Janthinobacterium sp. Mn2066]|uniref:hypothetical protein n=1 Tax=Janthinobacterium sp. Mn2066 TaxID=3395264 RepID=UPI003BE6686E